MKVLSCILFILGSIYIAHTQDAQSGKITFKETIKLHFDMGDEHPEMAKMFPSSQSVDKVLFYTKSESLYKNLEAPKDLDLKHEENGNDFQIVMKMPESIVYIHSGEKLYLRSQDLMGKEFLISDKPEKYKWKITGEQKTILNYSCQKALLQDTSAIVAVWFTSQIPVSAGPAGLSGLPGMILAVESDNGDRMTIATSIESLPESFAFTRPSKGKKVNRQEYEKIRADKMKEMGATEGKGGAIKMIITEERN